MNRKKELKAAYKNKKSVMGVFQIQNLTTGKVLIEGSTDVYSKWNRHQMELRFGSHRNASLQKDWNTYEDNNFSFKILSELEHKEDLAINYAKEVKVLEEMVLEELAIDPSSRY